MKRATSGDATDGATSPNVATEPPRDTEHVLPIAGELLRERPILVRGSKNQERRAHHGRNETPERPERDRQGEMSDDRSRVPRMAHESVGSGLDDVMAAFALDADDRGEERVRVRRPEREAVSRRIGREREPL